MGKDKRRKPLVRRTAWFDGTDFDHVLSLIERARSRATLAINTELIDLYWSIGKLISKRIADRGWGKGTVLQLARHIHRKMPNAAGFSASNLWRMGQFHQTYCHTPKLAPALRELPWTHNLAIMGRCKRAEEREFYLHIARRERWSVRELQRQLSGSLFERTILSPVKLAPALREIHPEAGEIFKDAYLLDFLGLPPDHAESDLHNGLIEKLKNFLIELGRDFCFVGSHYPLQVGHKDFEVDLLFFNRAINGLVAFELKIDEFQPEHLGKLEFYLEALDRNVRKPHERPSVGVLLCATKNEEVVEYALSRAVSPAVVAEYHTNLPDKNMLTRKLHEFYQLASAAQKAGLAPEINNRRLPQRTIKHTKRRRR